jgi:hypothetical protein
MAKRCKNFPWYQQGRPLITDILKESAMNDRFTCHVDLTICVGAENYKYFQNKKLSK